MKNGKVEEIYSLPKTVTSKFSDEWKTNETGNV